MSKYLNVFNTLAEYQAFSASTEYVQPNVALVKETNVLYYNFGDNKPQLNYTDYKVSSKSLVSDGGDTYGLGEKLCLNYIPSGVTSLKNAFSKWSSLKEVTCEIPDSVTSMTSTFKNCSSLVNAPVIPNSVTSLSSTFEGCSSLKEVTFLHTTPPSYNNALSGCSKLETIYVPDESVDAYKTVYGWSQFASKIKPLSEKPSK